MKPMTQHLLKVLLFLYSGSALGQGYLSVSGIAALTQNQLKSVSYKDGFGLALAWLSNERKFNDRWDWQLGAHFDWSFHGTRTFNVALNTPVPDNGLLTVDNQSAAIYAMFQLCRNEGWIRPYWTLAAGPREYNTSQVIKADNPLSNPDFESETTTNRVVYTGRMHVGLGFGGLIHLNENVIVDLGLLYSYGGVGAVQPLKKVQQDGNRMIYDHVQSSTDILLVRVGFRFSLNLESINPGYLYSPSDHTYQSNYPAPTRAPKQRLQTKPGTVPPASR
jgi:hypothetical protein